MMKLESFITWVFKKNGRETEIQSKENELSKEEEKGVMQCENSSYLC